MRRKVQRFCTSPLSPIWIPCPPAITPAGWDSGYHCRAHTDTPCHTIISPGSGHVRAPFRGGGLALWVQTFPSPLPSHLHLHALPHSLPVPDPPGTPIWPCLSPHSFLDASVSSTSGPEKNQFQQSLCVSCRTGKCFQNDSFESHDSRCLMLCALRVSLTKYRSLTSRSHSAACPYSVTSPSGYR